MIPTQIEFQKIDPILCDTYFTDLKFTGYVKNEDSGSTDKDAALSAKGFISLFILSAIAVIAVLL